MRIAFAFVALVAAAGCETAAGPAAPSAGDTTTSSVASTDAAPEKPQKAGKKICRTIPVTGSRMPVKTCKTADEWERAESGGQGIDRPEVQPQ